MATAEGTVMGPFLHNKVSDNTYIVASSRGWNRSGFERRYRSWPGHWTFVSDRQELHAALRGPLPRYIFFLHWSWYVPEEIYGKIECVCFHMTDVPYGRGGSPLQNLILNGYQDTKLSALRMVAELDAGPVYTKRPLTLDGKAQEIYIRAGDVSYDIISWMVESEPVPSPQSGHPFFFQRRSPAQSGLPLSGSLNSIYDHIRMLDAEGYPHAFLRYGEYMLEFSDARRDGLELVATVRIRK